jgi:hypothetical protein
MNIILKLYYIFSLLELLEKLDKTKIRIMKNIYHILAIISINIWLSPYYFLKENTKVMIHDNLDSYPNYIVSARTGFCFNQEVDTVLTVLGCHNFPSSIYLIVILAMFLKPFQVYMITQVISHHIAYIGMYLLVKNHVLKNKELEFIAFSSGLLFALIPFWPLGGLSISGMPLLLYIYKNKFNGDFKRRYWIIIIIISLYSIFLVFSIFLYFSLFLYLIFNRMKLGETIKDQIENFKPILLGFLTTLIVNYSFIISIFQGKIQESHRNEFKKTLFENSNFYNLSSNLFFNGQYHAGSVPSILVYFLLLNLLAILIITFWKNNDHIEKQKIKINLLLKLWFFYIAISILFAVLKIKLIEPILTIFPIIKIFQFDRFYVLMPLLLIVIFATSLELIIDIMGSKTKLNIKIIVSGCLLITLILSMSLIQHQGATIENPLFRNPILDLESSKGMSYADFYSEELFSKIKSNLETLEDNFRVISLGIHPAIAIYNGFKTLDGYLTNYDLSYKIEFRKIIEKELEKSDTLKNYFDNWGSRCYLFSSELGLNYMYTKDLNRKVSNLEVNVSQIFNLSGKFILSAVEIINYEALEVKFINIFEDDKSPWQIYVYHIDN